MNKVRIGDAVRRGEDSRLLQGRGRYVDDVAAARQARAYVLRSPHAHAEIAGMDVSAARAAPGVLAVLTGEDMAARGLGSLKLTGPTRRS
ncbi:MAG: xanthine dehydrogenase family protein molybdopterin-binding subunit, partial [Gemmatimonadetes bacterium]|nr:xanthine dehydrogenase family protein molybdopterin-binding subunit [Gemmatimonadota bacterium]